ncbi:RDD family protein [Hymenobacter antarcticus]|uniref:RDD family protein n=1 Tax=Hymenobacter antarcticus TaxID=486270 RepID=A0ABP7Q7N1_9BACT
MSSIRVHTAQNVTLEYEIASLGDRIVAAIIDYVILIAWAMLCAMLLVVPLVSGGRPSESSFGPLVILVAFLAYAPLVFYNLVCEVFLNGQSIGKKARNIKVMRLDGTAPSIGDYLLRWLLRIIDLQFAGLVAIISIAASQRGQRLGDMAAGTTVVKVRPTTGFETTLGGLSSIAGYQVVFPQVAVLADHDVALVRQLLQQASARGNYEVLNQIANKVKTLTGIQTDLQDEPFLKTVLRDYVHLATGN